MSARISEADARRLGIASPSAPKGNRAAARRLTPPSRPPVKTGRLPTTSALFPEITFALSLDPRPKERPRTFLPPSEMSKAFAASKGDPGRFMSIIKGGDDLTRIRHHTFTPKDTADFEKALAMASTGAMRGRAPIDVQVGVDVLLAFDGDPGLWPTANSDGDLDNLAKAVLDAANGIVFVDDRLVVEMRLAKICLAQPAIAMRVRPADPTLGGLADLLSQRSFQ